MNKHFTIAIDGPAGAGKSTVAKAVAARLGAIYLDTGAMYRAVGLYMLRNGVAPKDSETVSARAHEAKVDIRYVDGSQHVYLCGEDVSTAIRENEVSAAASGVSAVPRVREILVARQQEIAKEQPVVMDGRDIGTKVLPDATLKIFLTASAEERARRRFEELKAIIDGVGSKDVGVCLDTCHISDGGYDLIGDLDGVLAEFDRVIGLDKLKALHLNDSKNPFQSHKDRHELLGEGNLGIATFEKIVNHPVLKKLPMILETPNELPGYAREIQLLRDLEK